MNKTNDGLYEIADAIKGHSKSMDNLAQIVRWSFMTDCDENVADGLCMINNRLAMINTLIEEAGRLLDLEDIGKTLKEKKYHE
jgi:hypothetical protein|tara:strand:+ start:139 stop:387 length:249 start_codon:yes stop_codon:yes gene_type:complete